MKHLYFRISLALMLLPLIGAAQNPCLTSPSKALQSYLNNFKTTVEVGETYSDCVKIAGNNSGSLGIQQVQGEGTLATITVYPSIDGAPVVVPIEQGTFIPPIPLPSGDFGITVDLFAVGSVQLIYSRPQGNSGQIKTDIITINIVASSAFPVTWTKDLSYRPAGENVVFDWSVADEVDVRGYLLEADHGNGFESVAEIAFLDNGLLEKNYSAVQPWPSEGAYYRVKQMDYAGTFSLSNMVFVPGQTGAESLALFPNPANTSVRVVLPQQASAVALYQASGQRVGVYTAEEASRGIDVQMLPVGMYLVRPLGSAPSASQRLLIQH
ncbi:T9SS type A sorting domain-containing protein [Neolewinella litorea]|uniref:T9SS type A sorting domain-containing protein n=1 Tax=Neolewinella litorea TaxID=2562452 RepID=A0A4S4NR09_9BACT|nr:T9SS type A sorting domain-containing protein [Neolewinella litorea]THH41617.1 T9SS type A sorting domain-containing protein [Neolewinella litorea]